MPFTIEIPVKSYIKAYIENNCGSPADLSQLPEVNDLFTGCLKQPRFHRDKQTKCNYSDVIEIIISEDHFYRYGWQLSKTDVVKFNRKCEAFIKFNARQFIVANHSLGLPVSMCIREYINEYNFTEDSLPYETIKKDFDRHGKKLPVKFIRNYRQELKTILLGNLASIGTISKSFKNEQYKEV